MAFGTGALPLVSLSRVPSVCAQGTAEDPDQRGQPAVAHLGGRKHLQVLVNLTARCELVSMETALLWPTFRQLFQFLR